MYQHRINKDQLENDPALSESDGGDGNDIFDQQDDHNEPDQSNQPQDSGGGSTDDTGDQPSGQDSQGGQHQTPKEPTAAELKAELDQVRQQLNQKNQPQPQQQPQQQRQLSQDEINKMFQRPTVTADTYQQLFGVAPENQNQVTALQGLMDQAIKSATIQSYYAQMQQNKKYEDQITALKQQLQPVMQQNAQQVEAQHRQSFFQQYPNLKQYESLVEEIYHSKIARGEKYNSAQEAYAAIANQANNLIKQFTGSTGNPSGGQQNPVQVQGAPPQRKMVATGDGGHRGSQSSSAANGSQKSNAMQLFE